MYANTVSSVLCSFLPTSLATLLSSVIMRMYRSTATNLEIAPPIAKKYQKCAPSKSELIEAW